MYGVWNAIDAPTASDTFITQAVADSTGLIWLRKGVEAVGFGFECPAIHISDVCRGFDKLSVEHVEAGANFSFLAITCSDSAFFSLFQETCHDFIEVCKEVTSAEERLGIVINRATALNKLFARKRAKLSREQLLGLICELLFLQENWLVGGNPLEGWKGPLGAKQDFEGSSSLVEVKHMDADGVVRISSLEQLSADRPLFIAAIHLVEGDANGITLHDLSEQIRGELGPRETVIFDDLLIHYGFERSEQYSETFSLEKKVFYLVEGDFPSIVPSTNPALRSAKYSLDLSLCSAFLCAPEDMVSENGYI
jgi:hypothetical protein